MAIIAYIIIFTVLGSIISLAGGMLLLLKRQWSSGFILALTGFAAGALLATAFLDLFPEALENRASTTDVFVAALAGIVLFFLLERFFLWHHHHHESHGSIKPSVWLVTIGDGIHNFIDGVAITAAFLINIPLGITTAIAVAAHEIPQEIADFSVLITHGLTRKKAILFNLASACTSLVGAIVTYGMSELLQQYLPIIIAFTAGMFTYIASSDLIPELHHASSHKGSAWQQTGMFLLGIFLIFLVKWFIRE